MKKWIFGSAITLAMGMFATGCGAAQQQGNDTSNNTTTSAAKKNASFKVGLITDTGGLNDHGFNHLSYVGLQKAESTLGVAGSVVQSKSPADYVPNLTNFAQQGYNLVIAVGFLMTDAVEQVSKQYPNTKFLILDVPVTDRANVSGAVFKTEQSAFLAGALAGLLEQSKGLPKMNAQNVMGVVAGMKIPPVQEYLAGFQQGFKHTDPNGTLLVKWANSFSDQNLGNTLAKSEIASGADIVYQLAGGAGVGVIDAAKQTGVYAIGADTDQAFLAPKNILTSTLKRVDNATYDVIQQTVNGQFKSGVNYFDLKDQGVSLTSISSVVPKDIVAQVNALKSQITAGTLNVSPTAK